MRPIPIIFSFVVAVLFIHITSADEKQKPERSNATIEALIAKLAQGDNGERTKAWRELSALGPEAFPVVIEHLQDKQPSFREDSGSTDETWTVGRACFDVIRCNVEPFNGNVYSSSVPPEKYWWRPRYCSEFLNTTDKANEWLAARRDKSLVDLQIEALEWVTSHRAKRKAEISTEDRKQLLEELDTLRQTRKPLKPGIPWSR